MAPDFTQPSRMSPTVECKQGELRSVSGSDIISTSRCLTDRGHCIPKGPRAFRLSLDMSNAGGREYVSDIGARLTMAGARSMAIGGVSACSCAVYQAGEEVEGRRDGGGNSSSYIRYSNYVTC
jgi:hypothetical protein